MLPMLGRSELFGDAEQLNHMFCLQGASLNAAPQPRRIKSQTKNKQIFKEVHGKDENKNENKNEKE